MRIATANEIGRPHLDAALSTIPNEATADRLIEQFVRPDPHRPGLDRARVVVGERNVPIWALIGTLRGGGGIEQTAEAYEVPEEVVVAAVAYYARHRLLIDHRLAVNDGEA